MPVERAGRLPSRENEELHSLWKCSPGDVPAHEGMHLFD
jgi:hypothetical protein